MMLLYNFKDAATDWSCEGGKKGLIGSANMQIPCSIKGSRSYYKPVFSENLSGITERINPDFEEEVQSDPAARGAAMICE